MNKIIKAGLFVAVVGVTLTSLAATYSHDYYKVKNHLQHYAKKKNNVSLLFIHHAESAQFIPGATGSRCGKLVVAHPQNKVLYFTDAPVRDEGSLSINEFLQTWKHNHVQPNTAVLGYVTDSAGNSIEQRGVTELSHPVYKKKTLTFTACPLRNQTMNAYPTQKLVDVTLFIDPFKPWPP